MHAWKEGGESGQQPELCQQVDAVDTAELETGPNTHLINMFLIRNNF